MRNAAAHFDDDFDLVEPPRKKTPRRASSGKRKKGKRLGLGFGFNFDMQKVARYAAIGMSATVGLGIMVNALMMQKGHHPAPLFGKSIPLGQPNVPPSAPAPAKKVEAPPPAAKPAVATQADDPPAPPAKPKPTAHVDDSAGKPDPIARLLQGGGVDSEKPATKTVLGAQRALVKLGFVLKPNGNLGPQTKKAIEMFEKDRHLPVKGELSRHIVKILASESGVKIDH